MNEQNQRDSIMSMARGAFEERVDYEMDKVIQNILDPNTKATAKRKITLTIELTPDDERRTIGVSVTAKSTLAATNPVATALYVTSDGNGELVVAEMVPQVPGQMNMDGTQQEAPKLLKLVQHGYSRAFHTSVGELRRERLTDFLMEYYEAAEEAKRQRDKAASMPRNNFRKYRRR